MPQGHGGVLPDVAPLGYRSVRHLNSWIGTVPMRFCALAVSVAVMSTVLFGANTHAATPGATPAPTGATFHGSNTLLPGGRLAASATPVLWLDQVNPAGGRHDIGGVKLYLTPWTNSRFGAMYVDNTPNYLKFDGLAPEGNPWTAMLIGITTSSFLTLQIDGNLVVYSAPGHPALWSSGTAGTGAHNRLVLQSDTNLVLYNAAGRALWNTGINREILTQGQALLPGQQMRNVQNIAPKGAELTMQPGGNLVYTEDGVTRWSTKTSVPGSLAVMQTDGNFVVYTSAGKAVWSSHTDHNPGAWILLNDPPLQPRAGEYQSGFFIIAVNGARVFRAIL